MLLGARARGKGPGFDSSRGVAVHPILLDIDDDGDDVHAEGHKDDEDDKDDENEDEDGFEDKGYRR